MAKTPEECLIGAAPRSKFARYFLPLLVPINIISVPLYLLRFGWKASVKIEHGCVVVRYKDLYLRKNIVGMARGHILVVSALGNNHYTLRHELHHVEQTETCGFAGVLLGLLGLPFIPWWGSLLLWALMPGLVYLSASAVAATRGEDAYRGNIWEEGARGVDGRSCEHR